MAFAAGMLLTLPSALYLAALKDIAEAGVSTGEELLAILLFNVLMLSPALIPLLLLAVVPDGTKAAVERSDRWMREHQKRLVTVVAGRSGLPDGQGHRRAGRVIGATRHTPARRPRGRRDRGRI